MMLKYFQGLMQARFHSSTWYWVPNFSRTNSKKEKKKEGERNMEKKEIEMEKGGKKNKNKANRMLQKL